MEIENIVSAILFLSAAFVGILCFREKNEHLRLIYAIASLIAIICAWLGCFDVLNLYQ